MHDHATPKLTKNQNLVFDALMDAKVPLSAYSILDLLREHGFRAPLQVYRALEKLVELGVVHRLESLNAFVACQHPNCEGHSIMAFAICETCGSVSELSDPNLESRLEELAIQQGFSMQKSVIELRGQCEACR